MLRSSVLLLLMSCDGCKACKPSLPYPPPVDDSSQQDSGDSDADSGDSDSGHTGHSESPPIDTTPPPPCDVPEVEPNNDPTAPAELPLEQRACGTFTSYIDPESFLVSFPRADWVKIQVDAASKGSAADVKFNLVNYDDDDYNAIAYGSYQSSDPYMAFPIPEGQDYVIILSESYYGYGDNYTWEMLTSVIKPPVTWTQEEVEPNDTSSEPAALTLGSPLWGTIGEPGDLDWFRITVPDAEKRSLSVRVTAFREGSPADLRLILQDPSGKKYYASTGENSYDYDPWKDVTTDQAGDWLLELIEQNSSGSALYWYTLTVTLSEPTSTDTGGTDSGGTSTAR